MKLKAQDLQTIVNATLEHYNRRAEEFWAGTRDHDVSQNIAAMLQYLEGEPRFTILDFGCGPGRDLKVVAELGPSRSGWKAPHISLTWRGPTAAAKFGSRIFSSSIFRITISMVYSPTLRCSMYPVRSCRACCWNCTQVTGWCAVQLKSARSGWNAGRYGVYYDLHTWCRFVPAAGFVKLSHYYGPVGLPRERQPWLASVWRR